MAWCIFIYVLLPSLPKANVVFNYITWFSILYIVAAYIRLYPKAWFNSLKITGFMVLTSVILSWISVVVLASISRVFSKSILLCYYLVSDANKVLAFVTGVSAFLFFKNLKIGYSRIINTIAASTFGVLCIHANSDTMRRWLWKDVCNNVGAYKNGNVLAHAVFVVLAVFVLCTVLDIIRIRMKECIG